MKQRDEVALAIFAKRVSSERLNDKTKRGFEAAALEAYELADIFLAQREKEDPETILSDVLPEVGNEEV